MRVFQTVTGKKSPPPGATTTSREYVPVPLPFEQTATLAMVRRCQCKHDDVDSRSCRSRRLVSADFAQTAPKRSLSPFERMSSPRGYADIPEGIPARKPSVVVTRSKVEFYHTRSTLQRGDDRVQLRFKDKRVFTHTVEQTRSSSSVVQNARCDTPAKNGILFERTESELAGTGNDGVHGRGRDAEDVASRVCSPADFTGDARF